MYSQEGTRRLQGIQNDNVICNVHIHVIIELYLDKISTCNILHETRWKDNGPVNPLILSVPLPTKKVWSSFSKFFAPCSFCDVTRPRVSLGTTSKNGGRIRRKCEFTNRMSASLLSCIEWYDWFYSVRVFNRLPTFEIWLWLQGVLVQHKAGRWHGKSDHFSLHRK